MRRPRVLVPILPFPHQETILSESESTHLLRVLRLKEGDQVEAIDGKGAGIIAKIARVNGKNKAAVIAYIDKLPAPSESPLPLVVFSSILKGDAYSWVIEKCVELGVSRFYPLETDFCVVQTKKGPSEKFQIRWQTLADQTLKQCERLVSMQVETPLNFEAALKVAPQFTNLYALERAESALTVSNALKDKKTSDIALWIGPEGGWSTKEKQLFGAQSAIFNAINLGPYILRAETATLFGVSVLVDKLREKLQNG